MTDVIDKILAIGSAFDWITPVMNEMRGFNTLEAEGDYATCIANKMALEECGVKCSIEHNGHGGYMVTSNRS